MYSPLVVRSKFEICAEELSLVNQAIFLHHFLEGEHHWPHNLDVDVLESLQMRAKTKTFPIGDSKFFLLLKVAQQERSDFVLILDRLEILDLRALFVVFGDVDVTVHVSEYVRRFVEYLIACRCALG